MTCHPLPFQSVTKSEVAEDQKLEDQLDKLLKVDMDILKKLDVKK